MDSLGCKRGAAARQHSINTQRTTALEALASVLWRCVRRPNGAALPGLAQGATAKGLLAAQPIGPEISLYDLSIGAVRSGTAALWPLSGRPADALGLKPATSLVLAQGGCGPAGPDSVTAFRGVQGAGDERLVEVGDARAPC